MSNRSTVADRLAAALSTVLGTGASPWRLHAWDGSEAGPPGAPVVAFRSPVALRRLVWAPGELGLARGYVAGDIDIQGDVFATLQAVDGRLETGDAFRLPGARQWAGLARTAVALGAIGPPPPAPAEEFRPRHRGRRHDALADAEAVSHHYDVGNDFYALVLGPTLVYSCAVFADEGAGLDAAQEAKLDLVCRKLGLRPRMRLLDVGCGWGSLALHAAERFGVDVVGITLSAEQATLARTRVADAGLAGRIEIRVQDYRAVADGPFDAVSSVGMSEHVGRSAMGTYVRVLHDLLAPGGRLLNHAIAWGAPETTWDDNTFVARYVFPDGELISLADTVAALGTAFEVLDVEALRHHYVLTLRAWVDRLEKNWDAAVALVGEGRARVWRLYMAAAALSFASGKLGVNQVLVARAGGAPPPLRRTDWV